MSDLPTVTHEGVVKLGDLEIKVLQLSSGERVIEEESLRALMAALFGDDPDALTGCADDQTFAECSPEQLREAADRLNESFKISGSFRRDQ